MVNYYENCHCKENGETFVLVIALLFTSETCIC